MKKRTRMNIPFFVELVASYALIVLTLFLAMIPVRNKAMELARERYLVDARSILEQSCTQLQRTVLEIYQMPIKLSADSYYTRLKLVRLAPGEELPKEYAGCLHMAHKAFVAQASTITDADELFVYLPGSDVVLGKQRAFASLDGYLQFDLRLGEDCADRFREALRSGGGASAVHPAVPASIYQGEPVVCLLLSFTKPTDSAVICAALSEETLRAVFQMSGMPEGTTLTLRDVAGDAVYSSAAQEPGESFSFISGAVSLVNLEATIAIPNSYFAECIAPVSRMLATIQWVVGGACLVISLTLAFVGSSPLRRLASREGGGKGYYIKELNEIQETIDTANGEIVRLNDSLRLVLLVRMMYGPLNAEEKEQAKELLPQARGIYRVAVIEVRARRDQERATYFFHQKLGETLGGDFASVQLGAAQIAILFPSEESLRARLEEAFRAACVSLPEDAGASMGVSDPCAGEGSMGMALRHAQLCLLGQDEAVSDYCPPAGKTIQQPLSMFGTQLLYKYLTAGQEQPAQELFGKLIREYAAGGYEIGLCFRVLHFVLECAAADSDIPASQYTPYDAQPHEPMDASIAAFSESIATLCGLINLRRRETLREKNTDMVSYIRENYTGGDMYADAIAERFHTTRNQVYKTIREETGMSLNELVEKLRLEKAKEYLESTDLPIAQISAKLGYQNINTFYKAFKKKYGSAPGSMRG